MSFTGGVVVALGCTLVLFGVALLYARSGGN